MEIYIQIIFFMKNIFEYTKIMYYLFMDDCLIINEDFLYKFYQQNNIAFSSVNKYLFYTKDIFKFLIM